MSDQQRSRSEERAQWRDEQDAEDRFIVKAVCNRSIGSGVGLGSNNCRRHGGKEGANIYRWELVQGQEVFATRVTNKVRKRCVWYCSDSGRAMERNGQRMTASMCRHMCPVTAKQGFRATTEAMMV